MATKEKKRRGDQMEEGNMGNKGANIQLVGIDFMAEEAGLNMPHSSP